MGLSLVRPYFPYLNKFGGVGRVHDEQGEG